MSKNNKKILVVALVLTLVLIVGTTYAWLRLTKNSNTVNKITAGNLDLVLDDTTSEGIKLVNDVPKSYRQGMETIEYTFTLTNNSTISNYKLSLVDLEKYTNEDGNEIVVADENKIDDAKIRYILLKDGEEASADKSKILTDRVIDSGTIKKGQTISYTLRLWIDSRAENEVMGKIFNAQLSLVAEQTASSVATMNFKLGDYVKMTPTSTNYSVTTAMTGYDSDQTINPSELNLWRIVNINVDGTIDLVSNEVSSVDVYFKGKIGYQNLVSSLNQIASQYTNSKYTVASRHMGYSNQTGTITDTSVLDSTTEIWKSSTSTNSNEEVRGAGDVGYENDYKLVNNALGTLQASKAGTNDASYYWLSSRKYLYISSSCWYFNARRIDTKGNLDSDVSLDNFNGGSFYQESFNAAIRPIVTLKKDVIPTGLGTVDDPYVLA